MYLEADLHKRHQQSSDKDIILSYQGEITYGMVKSIIEMMMSRLDLSKDNPKAKKKVVKVLVEMLENLTKHVSKPPNRSVENKEVSISVVNGKNEYEVITSNYVDSQEKNYLTNWINKINSFDRDGLRTFYKKTLAQAEISEKGGAGLGFIDIARKSGQKLGITFDNVGKDKSFFTLKVMIEKI